MKMLNEDMTRRIDEAVRAFLVVQLGETPYRVSCWLNNDMLAIYAHGVVSPAEQVMMHSENDHKMLIEYKTQQFESVKNDFAGRIKQILRQDIKQVYTSITEDGIRIINVCIQS